MKAKRAFTALFLTVLLLGCTTAGVGTPAKPLPGFSGGVSPQDRQWIQGSLAVKRFLEKNPDAVLDIQQINSADFSSAQKKIFLEKCEKKWKDSDYFLVSSESGTQKFWAWLLPTQKTDCFFLGSARVFGINQHATATFRC